MQESVVDHLRNLILGGDLLPGQRLVQGELAERLGVSRTPIREALHKLAAEGLVTLSSYKGASVTRLSVSELEEIYAVRCALESHAAYLAAGRISEQELDQLERLLGEMRGAFHESDQARLFETHHQWHAGVYAATGRTRLCELAVQHMKLTDVYQRMALSLGRGASDPVVEHEEILDALRRRDGEAAGRLILTHLQTTASELIELFHKDRSQEAT
jgi:DNA-binding GntR family transcriptional regulator